MRKRSDWKMRKRKSCSLDDGKKRMEEEIECACGKRRSIMSCRISQTRAVPPGPPPPPPGPDSICNYCPLGITVTYVLHMYCSGDGWGMFFSEVFRKFSGIYTERGNGKDVRLFLHIPVSNVQIVLKWIKYLDHTFFYSPPTFFSFLLLSPSSL